LQTERALPPFRLIRLTLPARTFTEWRRRAAPAAPLRRLLLEVALLRQTRARRTAVPAGWRPSQLSPRHTAARRAAATLGSGPLFPALPEPGRRSIGFVQPLFSLGGVERVVMNQARILRSLRGWQTRLVVLGGGAHALLPEPACTDAFDDIVLVPGEGRAETDWKSPYLGAEMPLTEGRRVEEVVGLLGDLDVVVNTHSLAAHAAMGRLRRLGTRCYVAMHLVERGRWGEAIGTPHTALAFEHAYDGAIVISDGLRSWCRAQGWPLHKVHLIRNAPGHPSEPGASQHARAARAARRTEPLRALFLGRLDAQKGVDRLAALIAATRGRITWRVVGRPVLGDAPHPGLGLEAEPPISDPKALDAVYGWADVLVLPSRFEGVPLTVLEAQRLGCVVLATDAGQIGEVMTHGEDGLLVPQRDATEAAVTAGLLHWLETLAVDRALLVRIGERAAARVAGLEWQATMGGFLDHLDAVVTAALP
jgi:glycosyltransferase involved in cell wall biosynthesis